MKIGIIGAGAMGSLFSYYLQKAGNEVAVYEKAKETAAAMRGGFQLDFGGSKENIKLAVSADAAVLKDSSYIFVFVKSFATAVAMKEISPFVRPETRIVSLQNGIGNDETIRDMLPGNTLIYGTTTFGAAKTAPAEVRFGGMGNILIGGASEEAIADAINFLNAAGMPAAKSADPDTDVWKKAIVNAGINPLGALLNVPNGMIVKNEHSLALMRSIIAEAVTAANAHGLRLDASEMQIAAVAICEQTAANECSMLQDVKNKRRTEIESITGEIIAAAKKHNIETPSNTGVYQLIKALESGYLMH